jgi:hypothetical protein
MTRTYLPAGSIAARGRPRPAQPTPPGRRAGRPGSAPWWPLLVVLAVQAALSLRLVWSTTAFQDEALYLRAGHLEWAHWLHQAAIPRFPAYFSGAPVLYPPLAAVADSLGGLAAARLLSLCFMLGVTGFLWATTARLYGRRAALLASGLFATLAGTQFLGAFATFDALALFLLALAAWLAVRAAVTAGFLSRTVLLVAAGLALAAASTVTYPTVLFTPVVLAVAALASWREQPGRAWLTALATAGGSWLALAGAAAAAGGRAYWRGVTASTLARAPGDVPVTIVLRSAYVWTSLILVLAVLGAAVALAGTGEPKEKPLPAVLAAAALLAPAGQALLHTTVSLHKHVVPGAWFAAIAAGYAMARLSRVDPGHGWAAVMALPIAAATLFGSLGQAAALFRAWPDSAAAVTVLRSAVRAHPGQYLAEDYDVEAYYLRDQVPWPRWSNTWFFRYRQGAPGAPSYAAAISRHYFSLVILNFGDTAAADALITADIRRAGGYYVLARTGPFTIWASRAPAPAGSDRGRH